MYTSAFDVDAALFVGRLAPGGDEARDFPEHIERMIVACDQTAGGDHAVCILAIIEREHSLPTPKVRRAVADAMDRGTFRPHLAIVASNPLVRGVLTAISWLRKPDFALKMFGTTAEAIAWLEKQRGESLPRLAEMVAEVSRAERAAG